MPWSPRRNPITRPGASMAAALAACLVAAAAVFGGTAARPAVAACEDACGPGDGPVVVAAVGDSNTFGYGVPAARRPVDSYPAHLQTLLGPGFDVHDLGVSRTTLLSTSTHPYTRTDAARESTAIDPDVVLIMLGTNDSKEPDWRPDLFSEELTGMVRSYQDLPSRPSVVLLTPPAAYDNSAGIRPDVVDQQVAPRVREVAAETGATMVDVHEATTGHPELFPDGVHPGAEGYGLVARLVAPAVRAAARIG
jgi:acyl-CoA thioesterase-1